MFQFKKFDSFPIFAKNIDYGYTNDLCLEQKHYADTPMQYTAIFHGCKNVNFQMKNYNIFLFLLLNIDCGYTLEPPQ